MDLFANDFQNAWGSGRRGFMHLKISCLHPGNVNLLQMISIDFSGIHLKLKEEAGKTFVFDPVRKKWLVLTPEEHVRQYFLRYLIDGVQYSPALIAVEKKIMV